jgi:hypothetical protein
MSRPATCLPTSKGGRSPRTTHFPGSLLSSKEPVWPQTSGKHDLLNLKQQLSKFAGGHCFEIPTNVLVGWSLVCGGRGWPILLHRDKTADTVMAWLHLPHSNDRTLSPLGPVVIPTR